MARQTCRWCPKTAEDGAEFDCADCEPCARCGGDGDVFAGYKVAGHDYPTACPSCGGSGRQRKHA